MFKCDLSRAFDVGDPQFIYLRQRSRSHRAGNADLCLTAAFGSAYRGVLLYHIAYHAGYGKRVKYFAFGHAAIAVHVVKHRRDYPRRAAGRRGHNGPVGGVFLGDRERVCRHLAVLVDERQLKFCIFAVKNARLALKLKTAAEDAGRLEPAFYAFLHCRPDRRKMGIHVRLVVPHVIRQRHAA